MQSKLVGFLRGRYARGVFWNALGTLFAQGSTFLTAVLLARLLGKEVFGELGMIQSTLLTLASISQVSTGLTATKYVAEFRDTDKARAGRVLGLCSVLTLATGVVATVLLLISAPWLAEHMLAAPHLAVSLAISAAFVLFSVMNGYQIGALAGLESYKSISVYGALLGAAHLALCGLGAMLWGLHGALGGLSVSALLRWGVYGLVLRREIKKQGITMKRQEGFKERAILNRFALPAALSGLTAMPAIWFGNVLLVKQVEGYSEMGLYTAVNNIRALMLMMPVLLNNVGTAVLNNKFGNKNDVGYWGLYSANIKMSGLLALAGAVVMILLGDIIPVWYGMKPTDSSLNLIVILSAALIFEALAVSCYQLIQTKRKMWTSFFLVSLPRDLSMIGVAIVFIPIWGASGLGAAYASAWVVAFFVITALALRLKMKPDFLDESNK